LLTSHVATPSLHSFPTRRSSDLTLRGARRNSRRAAARPPAARGSHSATFPRHSPRRPQSHGERTGVHAVIRADGTRKEEGVRPLDRKSTRLNSSHVAISYAVFCL